MATATFVHDGKSIDYTPGADVSAGDVVVQNDLVGIAKLDIASGALGALAVTGVFDVPKTAGVGEAIAAGAKVTLNAFVDELNERGLTNVAVRQVGGMGLEHAEPTVEVRMADMPNVIYGTVTDDIAREIVRRHIIGKELVSEHIYDRPSADIVRGE